MRTSNFSLQPLRRLLERQEQMALLQYAHTVAALERARTRQLALERELDGLCLLYASKLNSPDSSAELVHLRQYVQTIEQEKKLQHRESRRAQSQVQLAFAKLVAARKASAVVKSYHDLQKRQSQRSRCQPDRKVGCPQDPLPVRIPSEVVWGPEPVWN